MDNGFLGQTNNSNSQPFFTSGAGMPIENEAALGKHNNIEYPNDPAQWSNTIERNPRNIGNSAMHSREIYSDVSAENNPSGSPEMGRIMEMSLPPGREASEKDKVEDAQIASRAVNPSNDIIDISSYSEKGNTISAETLKGVEHKVSEFKRGKISPAELDDSEWEGTKAYLKNSFNRDIAA